MAFQSQHTSVELLHFWAGWGSYIFYQIPPLIKGFYLPLRYLGLGTEMTCFIHYSGFKSGVLTGRAGLGLWIRILGFLGQDRLATTARSF